MKIKIISLLLGVGLCTNLSAATERMCFGQVPIETSSELVAKITVAENNYFTKNKCKGYFSYYEKHLDFSKAECETNKDQVSLDKGYAPFGAFFRGTDSTGKDNIASYDWEIKNSATNEILTTYNAFNASYVFNDPGEYSATLTITDNNGNTSTDIKNITVWAPDGKDYYVDSVIGDDRYTGLAQTPDNNCDANTAPLNSCTGPWKTATRAFGEMAPYQVTNYPNGEYTADNICSSTETVDIVRYKQGNFKIFRSSAFVESEALKDKDGKYLPVLTTQLCSNKVAQRGTALRPGDQVLFNRGQQFKLETGVNTIQKYTATGNGITYNYEKLKTSPIIEVGHWTQAKGVHFGVYGAGESPIINNTGKVSSMALHFKGVGMFGFAMSDLEFNLNSNIPNPLGTRSTFLTMNGNPINTVFNKITVKEMNHGLGASVNTDAQGLFVFNSSFYDSKVTQLFTNNSYNDVAIINNTFDYSYNHLIYSSISHGLVYKNTLSRPAFGRTAYRLAGGSFTDPNNYVWISDNNISGWIDPRTKAEFGGAFADGKRYNYSLINISPNTSKDKAIHDISFTRNMVSDAESMLFVGVGENIKIHHNTFQSADSSKEDRLILNAGTSQRPLKNIYINNNKFIETAPTITGSSVASFINLKNYYQKKCTEQFNHSNINITKNTFHSLHKQRRILTFTTLKQGNDLSNTALPDLTLDQAEEFLNKELTMSNNQLISADSDIPTIQIGGSRLSNGNNSANDVNWAQYFQSSDRLAGDYRLYNNLSQFTQQLTGGISWDPTDPNSIETLLASNTTAGSTNEPRVELTWDDIIVYAEENNISPADLEVMILNQVLATNPSYSMPGLNYSDNLSVFEEIEYWFTSIPSSIASLFETEEEQWDDAKQLATINSISSEAVMISMTKK